MEEKWPSPETDAGGDNLENVQNQRKCNSASSSSRCIRQSIDNLVSNSSVSMDLSRKNLQHLTDDIYKLYNLKHLHLEGNALSVIPEDFFERLPNLVWLDLRYNNFKELPSGIGFHKQLKTLLLERNPIKRLPIELGNLSSLTALNLRHCPLEFPPPEVIQKGLQVILSFLRNCSNQNPDYTEPITPDSPSALQQEAKAIVREYKRKCDRPPDRRKAFNDLWKQMSFHSEFSRILEFEGNAIFPPHSLLHMLNIPVYFIFHNQTAICTLRLKLRNMCLFPPVFAFQFHPVLLGF